MNISRVEQKTLSSLRREKKQISKILKEQAEEKKVQEYIGTVAKSMVQKIPRYKLSVYESDEFVASDYIASQLGKLEMIDSVWAPWNKLCKYK